MDTVVKFLPIPRLSVIIPIGRDLAAFESTLISVLENRPDDCEVLVANDGSYDDPFELCDEVRFVVGDSANTLDLITAGVLAARARVVHILADGVQATCGWLDAALEKFEHHDAAAVAPVIRHSTSGQVIAAGWGDTAARLCVPLPIDAGEPNGKRPPFIGPFLQASLWQTEILRSLTPAYTGRDVVAASYTYCYLVQAAGWRCVLAHESNLRFDSLTLPWDQTHFRRGQQLRAIRTELRGGPAWPGALQSAAGALMRNLARPQWWSESAGQACSPWASAAVRRELHRDSVRAFDQRMRTLTAPELDLGPRRLAS